MCKRRTEVEGKLGENGESRENGAKSLRFISSESRSPEWLVVTSPLPALSVAVPHATDGFTSSGSGIRQGGAAQWW